ncbi:MAG: phospholipase D family protein [Treponema sp.]|jgi:hypothetical protein|nr:phospholipase D family protein [Treponema sp.]
MLFNDISNALSVVRADFIAKETLTWEELFDGFNSLRAITYSSSVDFVCKLLKKFNYAEIIFGFEEVLSSGIEDILAYQSVSGEFIKEISGKNKMDLVSLIDGGALRLFIAREQLSHEKTYILEADDGRQRVIIGSANLSNAAFSGKQRENICYFDDNAAFDYYSAQFNRLKANSADDITKKCLMANASRIDALPIAQTVLVKNCIVLQPSPVQDESARFVVDVKESLKKYAEVVSKDEKPDKQGIIRLIPETIKRMQRRFSDRMTQEKELKKEYPTLIIDVEAQTVSLNGTPLDLSPNKDDVRNDVSRFLEYMDGFNDFHGDVATAKKRYFELANWFFAAPFMAPLRTTAAINNHNLLSYPSFALLYGQSNAGKSEFLETLLKMTIGLIPKNVENINFTKTFIYAMKHAGKGTPIIFDDIDKRHFDDHAVETVKNDRFGVADKLLNYSAVVICVNEDVKVVAPEMVKRMAVFRVRIGIDKLDTLKSNLVRRIQKNIGTAFYREYLRRMLPLVSDMLDVLRSEDEEARPPDILKVSSDIITSVVAKSCDETPEFVRRLTLEDYFGEKVIASATIKTIVDAWRTDKKNFVINKKLDELRYNAAQTYEADRIIKELPEKLEPRRSREWVIMRLAEARKFFDIDFKNRLFM